MALFRALVALVAAAEMVVRVAQRQEQEALQEGLLFM
jgi:hypothetical protein